MAHSLLKLLLVSSLLLLSTGGLYTEDASVAPEPPYARHTTFVPTRVTPKEVHCLTQAIYYEAGNQSRAGKEAVALVVINRVTNARYPNSICGVVNQSFVINEKRICQFSFRCEPHRGIHRATWNESYFLAKRILTNSFDRAILSRVNDALFFHASYVHPQWSKQKVLVTRIDQHFFYKEPRT